MIELKMCTESITDLFTPGVTGIHECVNGLPKNTTLVSVKMHNDNTILYVFDDGKEKITKCTLKFICPIDKLKQEEI